MRVARSFAPNEVRIEHVDDPTPQPGEVIWQADFRGGSSPQGRVELPQSSW